MNENGGGRWRGVELWYLSHLERSRIDDQALPFRTRHHLCRQEVATSGSQQLRAQDRAPARRCGTKGKQDTRDRREETVTGTGTRAGTGGRTRTGEGTGTGAGGRAGTIIDMRVEERESLGTDETVIGSGSEDARERATPTSNQQPQPQDPTPQRDRRIMRSPRVQRRGARGEIVEGGGETTKRKKIEEV